MNQLTINSPLILHALRWSVFFSFWRRDTAVMHPSASYMDVVLFFRQRF